MIHANTTDLYAVPLADFVKALGLPWPEEGQILSYRVMGSQEFMSADGTAPNKSDPHVSVTVQRSYI